MSFLLLLSSFLVACLALDMKANPSKHTTPDKHLVRKVEYQTATAETGMKEAATAPDGTVMSRSFLEENDATSNTQRSSRLTTWRQVLMEDSELFAGCSNIFLDIGANRGTHVRKLFEPQKYPDSPYLHVFDEGFGAAEHRTLPSAETGICAFGFEANPRWTSTLQQIEEAYTAQGWRVKWFAPEAVGNTPGKITFWNNDAGNNSDWGFSVRKMHDYSTQVDVPVIDLSDFIEELNKTAPAGYRLMKMDIESAEFFVLPKFLTKQLLCKNVLDSVTIEWHDYVFTSEASKQRAAQLKRQVNSTSKCTSGPSTNVVELDDESYGEDGLKLPITWWSWFYSLWKDKGSSNSSQ